VYRKSRTALVLALATTALCAIPPAPAENTHEDIAQTLQTIVVTARKRSENIQNVPSSVTAISENLIRRIQANNLGDIAAYVPSLNVISGGVDANRLVIRGLTTGPNDLSPTVGVYLDNAPFGASTGFALGAFFSPDVDPSDLENVEVLRGPQGTLYGASSLGGLVKYVTKPPDLRHVDGHLILDGTDEDQTGTLTEATRAGANIPIIRGAVALRLSGFFQNVDGNLTNIRTGQTGLNGFAKHGGRADLLIQPNGQWKIDLIAMFDNSDVPHVGIITGNAVTLQPTYGPYSGLDYVDSFAKSSYAVYVANIHYELGNGITATSTTSWSRFSVNELGDDTTDFQPAFGPVLGPLLAFAGPVRPTTRRFTEELRLESPSNRRLEWMGGLYYDHEDSDYLSGINTTYLYGTVPPVLAPTLAALANYETVNDANRYLEKAVYGNATYHFLRNFDVSGGLRYSEIDQRLTSQGSGLLEVIGVIPALATPTSTDHVVTASLSSSWHFRPDKMLYARVSQGFRPGGPNLTGKSFKSDTTWNYELGLKARSLGGRLTTDLSAFYIDWKDIQLNFFNGTTTIIGNAGNARSKGIEFETSYIPVRGLTIAANAAYTDAYISSLIAGAQGGAAVGDRLPFDSTWTAALRADY
jgi:iron complex outermembrane receptor protein